MIQVVPTRKGGDWYDGGQYRELHMHAWTANTSAVKNAWSRSTEAISACNLIYETISTSALEESAKARALAEIRGRRIWKRGDQNRIRPRSRPFLYPSACKGKGEYHTVFS